MKKVIISRDKKLASMLALYWIIGGVSKKDFMHTYNLNGDFCEHDSWGQVISRINPASLAEIGVPIKNGQVVELELPDDIKTIFVCTQSGSLSNEISLDEIAVEDGIYKLNIGTKGGFRTISYPYLYC